MKFLPEIQQFQQKQAKRKSQSSNHKRFLIIIYNFNRLYLTEIEVDYKNEKITCSIFDEMASRKQEICQQIFWQGKHQMMLKKELLIINHKLALNNHIIMQKQQYLVGSKGFACKILVNEKTQQIISSSTVSVEIIQKILIFIYLSVYNNKIMVETKMRALFCIKKQEINQINYKQTKINQLMMNFWQKFTQIKLQLQYSFLEQNFYIQYFYLKSQAQRRFNKSTQFKRQFDIPQQECMQYLLSFNLLATPELIALWLFKQNDKNQQIQASFEIFKLLFSNICLLCSLLA
ncbi:hypothetical protein TTHERM_00592880 (macronuclear) [Tetrahymena thermophila SB210]|uniref:Uncharacterized protein n=1 Tax=Tetrahymena thermophila (strain SB210) TaxID=312017 RepID=Q232L0_TETTS|nr:hypothetical protein TTHERM_00592880 [Tetrahymena thermophila SB210]EAR91402.2 hypothetical protein TTHERM_00592880 [Tetrahymena thermophila SB210]|eukprot:XP_001011647.2 hypothetical protein TTHERM_00592880 [Tetrahymena thermophila SB210]